MITVCNMYAITMKRKWAIRSKSNGFFKNKLALKCKAKLHVTFIFNRCLKLAGLDLSIIKRN